MSPSVRLHLLCAPGDLATVRAALDAALPGWLSWSPVGGGPDEGPVRCYLDSGQWTPALAAQIASACAPLPVRVVRGVALGIREEGVVVVDKGAPAPRVEAQARRTLERAVEEWHAEQGEPGNPHKPR